nr:MAG TPA: hypothetical protein [Caudoviricetes sp.]
MTKDRKKTLRLLLYDYRLTDRYYTIYRTFKSKSSDDFTTIPRLFYWRNYDYSSRNATTIARSYWLSGESPKRDTAAAVNGSAPPCPPAAGLPRRVEGAGLTRYQIVSRRACMVCAPLIYLIIIGRLC